MVCEIYILFLSSLNVKRCFFHHDLTASMATMHSTFPPGTPRTPCHHRRIGYLQLCNNPPTNWAVLQSTRSKSAQQDKRPTSGKETMQTNTTKSAAKCLYKSKCEQVYLLHHGFQPQGSMENVANSCPPAIGFHVKRRIFKPSSHRVPCITSHTQTFQP